MRGHSIFLPRKISASLSPKVKEAFLTTDLPVVRVRKVSITTKQVFLPPNPPISCRNSKPSPYPSFNITGIRYSHRPLRRVIAPDKDSMVGLRRKESLLMRSLVIDQRLREKEMEETVKYAAVRLKKHSRHLTSVLKTAIWPVSPFVSQPISPKLPPNIVISPANPRVPPLLLPL